MWTVLEWKSNHKEGTKFYKVTLISNSDLNKQIVVFEWGKIGYIGQISVERFNGMSEAKAVLDKKVKEKSGRRGYNASGADLVKEYHYDDLGKLRGRHLLENFKKLGKINVKHIAPDADLTFITDQTGEDARNLSARGRGVEIPGASSETAEEYLEREKAQLEAQRLAEEKARQKEMANPDWGAF